MREVSESLKACTTLCEAWRITFSNNSQLGFTDHDRPLWIEGLKYHPSSGFEPGGDQDVKGILRSDLITPEDIGAGRFDGARIDRLRVNWQNPPEYVHMATGYIGEITQQGRAFTAQWLGQASRLERSTGRVFSRRCEAEFGDAQCGVNKADFPDGTTCPHTFEACRDRFSNSLNFRGFPYLLGDDALTAGPQEGELRDGGSRYS